MHCYAHDLNRALVNAACDTRMLEIRNFFGIVELLFTFVEGSAARHAYFVNIQKEFSPDEPALHLKGLVTHAGTVERVRCRDSQQKECSVLRSRPLSTSASQQRMDQFVAQQLAFCRQC